MRFFSPCRQLAFLFCMFALPTTGSSTLRKRGTSSATLDIPLTLDSNQRYIANVNMSSGPNTQPFKFALAANTGYSAVAGVGCDTCDGVPTYNASASTSSQPIPGSKNVSFTSASANGTLIKEDCGLRELSGVTWKYPNQTVVVVNQSSDIFSSGISGILGLGTNSDGSDFDDTIFGQWMIRNPTQNNFSYGMALGAPDSASGEGGVLHWLAPDTSFYEGEVTYNQAQAQVSNSNDSVSSIDSATPQSDWVVQMNGWVLNSGGASAQNASTALATIEPWYPNIYFPLSDAQLIYDAIPGASLQPGLINGSNVWSIPCDSQFSLSLNFGQSFSIDQSHLIIQNGSSCIGGIQGWSDSSETSYLLGGRFISSLYLIFVIGRPGSGISNAVGFATLSSAKTSKHIAAIVGGTLGGVALIAAVFLSTCFCKRRQMGANGQSEKTAAPTQGQGTQYARDQRSSYMPTPPMSASSQQPFLSEPHSPHSPYLDSPIPSNGGADATVRHWIERPAETTGARGV